MDRVTKIDVENLLGTINDTIPQVGYIAMRREIRAEYNPHYGGWLFCYYDEKARAHPIWSRRISTKEAHKFLQGILFSLTSF